MWHCKKFHSYHIIFHLISRYFRNQVGILIVPISIPELFPSHLPNKRSTFHLRDNTNVSKPFAPHTPTRVSLLRARVVVASPKEPLGVRRRRASITLSTTLVRNSVSVAPDRLRFSRVGGKGRQKRLFRDMRQYFPLFSVFFLATG